MNSTYLLTYLLSPFLLIYRYYEFQQISYNYIRRYLRTIDPRRNDSNYLFQGNVIVTKDVNENLFIPHNVFVFFLRTRSGKYWKAAISRQGWFQFQLMMAFKVRIDFTVENIRFLKVNEWKIRVTELAKCFERLNSLFDDSIVVK